MCCIYKYTHKYGVTRWRHNRLLFVARPPAHNAEHYGVPINSLPGFVFFFLFSYLVFFSNRLLMVSTPLFFLVPTHFGQPARGSPAGDTSSRARGNLSARGGCIRIASFARSSRIRSASISLPRYSCIRVVTSVHSIADIGVGTYARVFQTP